MPVVWDGELRPHPMGRNRGRTLSIGKNKLSSMRSFGYWLNACWESEYVPGCNRDGREMWDRALLAVLLCYQNKRWVFQAYCCIGGLKGVPWKRCLPRVIWGERLWLMHSEQMVEKGPTKKTWICFQYHTVCVFCSQVLAEANSDINRWTSK